MALMQGRWGGRTGSILPVRWGCWRRNL